MSPDELELRLQQALALLPPPAGIPPGSNNPRVHKAAGDLMAGVTAVIIAILRIGPPSPLVPTPTPPSSTP
jgi:hypothetical protein